MIESSASVGLVTGTICIGSGWVDFGDEVDFCGGSRVVVGNFVGDEVWEVTLGEDSIGF